MIEAYSVGIRVSLINGVSAGLIGMAREFGAANLKAKELQASLHRIKATMLVGAGLTMAGLGIFAMLKPALDQARQFQQQVQKFSLYGMGDAATTEAVRFAKAMDIIGSSYTDNMRLLVESQGIFRESGKMTLREQLEGAKIATPILAKLALIESGLNDDQKSSRHAQDLAMLRFVEARGGANDPRQFASIADWGYRLMQSSGGVVNWSQLQQLVAAAGPMTRTLTQDAISELEPVIADLKGGRVGSGLRVSFQQLLGTRRGLPKQAVAEYLNLGLWDPSKVELSKQGSVKRFLGQPGDVFRYSNQFMADPVEFYTKTFLPALARKYGPSILGGSADAVRKRSVEEALVFGPGTASQLFSQIDKLLPTIQRSVAAQNKQMPLQQAYELASQGYSAKQIDLIAQWRNFLELAGEQLLPTATKLLGALASSLKDLNGWLQKNPQGLKNLVQGIAALGAVLTVSGVITSLAGIAQAIGLLGRVVLATGIISGFPGMIGNIRLFAGLSYGTISTGLTGVSTAMKGMSLIQFAAIAGGLVAVAGGILAVAAAAKMGSDYTHKNASTPGAKIGGATQSMGAGGAIFGGVQTWFFNKVIETMKHMAEPHGRKKPYAHPASYSGGAHREAAVYLDGKKVGKAVLAGIVSRANTAPASGAGFDGSAAYTPVGTGMMT